MLILSFQEFFRLILAGRYPLDNIAFLLWIETVNWYKQDTTSGMRYMDHTKTFWKLGWRHFEGRFIRFMTGFKNMAQVVNCEAEPGLLRPEESDIYFAVPAIHTLRNFRPYGGDISERAPGTFIDVIKKTASALEGSSACIYFNGKKLEQGLTKEYGDVDLLGFEVGSSLKDRKEILAKLISQISDLKSILLTLYLTATIDAETVSKETKGIIVNIMFKLLNSNSTDTTIIISIKSKKEYALNKFIERGGSEWRQSKLAYVIIAIRAFLFYI